MNRYPMNLFSKGMMVTISGAPQMAVLADEQGKPLLDEKQAYRKKPQELKDPITYVE